MAIKNKVFINASWIIICRVVQSVLALIISMITARYLGPSNYGLLNYAMSVVAFVVPLMKLGINSVIVQKFIEDPDKEGEILGTSIVLNVFSAFLCIFGVNAFVFFANAREFDTIIVCALYSTVLLFQAFEIISFWFQKNLISKYSSIVSLIAYVIVAIYKIYLLITQKSIFWFALANSLDYLLIAIGLLLLYRVHGGQHFSFNSNRAKQLLSIGKYYIISDLMIVVFSQTDRVMLKAMLGNSATGFYSAAIACTGMTQFVFAAIIDSFRPSIFEGHKESTTVFEQRLTLLYSIIIYVSLAQCVLVTAFSRYIILVLYGSAYLPASSALKIVVWYTLFSYIGAVRNIWILALNKQHYLWRINLIGALVNVVMNFLLIPIWDIAGAAIASLFTQFFTNIVVGFLIKDIRPNNKIIWKSLNPSNIKTAFSILK